MYVMSDEPVSKSGFVFSIRPTKLRPVYFITALAGDAGGAEG